MGNIHTTTSYAISERDSSEEAYMPNGLVEYEPAEVYVYYQEEINNEYEGSRPSYLKGYHGFNAYEKKVYKGMGGQRRSPSKRRLFERQKFEESEEMIPFNDRMTELHTRAYLISKYLAGKKGKKPDSVCRLYSCTNTDCLKIDSNGFYECSPYSGRYVFKSDSAIQQEMDEKKNGLTRKYGERAIKLLKKISTELSLIDQAKLRMFEDSPKKKFDIKQSIKDYREFKRNYTLR